MKTLQNFILLLALVSILSISSSPISVQISHAQIVDKENLPSVRQTNIEIIERLIKEKRRPSVLTIKSGFRSWPKENIFAENTKTRKFHQNYAEDIRPILVRSIARLEALYPGAVWAPLGRDSAKLAEALEMFYLSLGENDRVFPLEGSSGSIINGSPDILFQFLQTNGLRENFQKRPYIVIDTSSYRNESGIRPGSQSTYLMHAAYLALTQKGYSFDEILPWVNFVSTSDRYNFQADRNPLQAIENYEKQMKDFYKSFPKTIFPPQTLGLNVLGDRRSMTYTTAWHDSYGTLIQDNDGVVRGHLNSNENSKQVRLIILSAMYELDKIVSDPKFLEDVVQEAKHLGYDFQAQVGKNIAQILRERQKEVARLERERQQVEIEKQRQNWKNIANHKVVRALVENLSMNPESVFEYRLMALVSQLKPITYENHVEAQTYFSSNGESINDAFQLYLENKERVLLFQIEGGNQAVKKTINNRVFTYLKYITVLFQEDLISHRDYRRLILFALAKLDETKKSFDDIQGLIKSVDSLRDVLIKEAEVYITSKKNHGRASEIYIEMIKRGFLPQVDCHKLL